MAQYSVNWSATLSSTTGVVAVGTCLVKNGSAAYVPGTAANRTSYGRCAGIAETAGDANNLSVALIVAGPVAPSITNLSAGTASWVRVSSTAVLERVTTPSGSDDVVGWCETDGTLHAAFGFITPTMAVGGGGGSAPTGNYLYKVTAGVMDAASVQITDSLVAAGAAIALSKIVNPTGTGLVKTSAGVIAAAGATLVDADVAAGAAIALSKIVNPTGTGLVKTSGGVIAAAGATLVDADVNAAAAIAASKVVQATGTGIPHVVGGALSAASSLIVDADVNAAAAIAGSKVAPNFGAQNIVTTGTCSLGTTPATAGTCALPNAGTIQFRDGGNTANITAVRVDSGDLAYFGNTANCLALNLQCKSTAAIYLSVGAATDALALTSAAAKFAVPVIGNAAPFAGLNGLFSKTLTAAQSYDLTTTEYNQSILKFITSGGNIIRLPPATDAQGTMKFVWNVSGVGTLAVKDTNNVAAAATLASGTGAWFLWANSSVVQLTAAFAVA